MLFTIFRQSFFFLHPPIFMFPEFYTMPVSFDLCLNLGVILLGSAVLYFIISCFDFMDTDWNEKSFFGSILLIFGILTNQGRVLTHYLFLNICLCYWNRRIALFLRGVINNLHLQKTWNCNFFKVAGKVTSHGIYKWPKNILLFLFLKIRIEQIKFCASSNFQVQAIWFQDCLRGYYNLHFLYLMLLFGVFTMEWYLTICCTLLFLF